MPVFGRPNTRDAPSGPSTPPDARDWGDVIGASNQTMWEADHLFQSDHHPLPRARRTPQCGCALLRKAASPASPSRHRLAPQGQHGEFSRISLTDIRTHMNTRNLARPVRAPPAPAHPFAALCLSPPGVTRPRQRVFSCVWRWRVDHSTLTRHPRAGGKPKASKAQSISKAAAGSPPARG